MEHKNGQVAEYGTDEVNNHRSERTVLETGTTTSVHGIQRRMELYHVTAGYKPAGSCAIWTSDSFGVRIYYSDGTTGGICGRSEQDAREYFARMLQPTG